MTGFPINPPNAPLTDGNGMVTPEWYKFFLAIQRIIGGPSNPFDDGALLASMRAPVFETPDPSLAAAQRVVAAGADDRLEPYPAQQIAQLFHNTAGAALTKVDDTNVTLTLGGTPATSLLRAVSLTLGWTGILSSSRGGTGNGFTKFSGPATSEKTFTLPNASDTVVCYGVAGSFTAAQTFLNSSGIKILDTNASHTLGLVVGSNLTADRTLTFTTGDADRTLDISAGSVTISAAGAALIDDADASAQRTTLGLGTAAVKNTGTSGNTIPLLDSATCTWTNGANFGAAVSVTSGNILASTGHIRCGGAAAGIGYTTGAGSTVTQNTSKATGVAINRPTGEITMNNAALAADAIVTFTMTNSAIAAADRIDISHHSAGTFGAYMVSCHATGAGTADITVTNVSTGSLSEAIVLKFSLIKSVTS